jgi:hypothetical protein
VLNKGSKHNEDVIAYRKKTPAHFQLRAIHPPQTNKHIEGFPRTRDSISDMPRASILSVLLKSTLI